MSDYDDYREYKRDYDKQYRIKNLEKIKENNKLRHTKEYNKKQYQKRNRISERILSEKKEKIKNGLKNKKINVINIKKKIR